MADQPVRLDVPIQWEIGDPRSPSGNRIIKPAQPRGAGLVPPEEAAKLAKSIGLDGRLCSGCRYFDLDAGRRMLDAAGGRERANITVGQRSGWWGEGELGQCRRRAATLVQATGSCEQWEVKGKLVSFTGQGSRG